MLKKSFLIVTLLMLLSFVNLGVAYAETNYALGKPYYTTVDSTYLQGTVTDGTTYFTPFYFVVGTGSPQAVIVDLKSNHDINKIKVWHYWADGRTYSGTKTEVSEDGITWQVVFDSNINGTYQETKDGKTNVFTTRKVRYIRDWMNGSTTNSGNHWIEVQAFGPESSNINSQNSAWSWTGEKIDGLSGRFSGPVSLSTDRVIGKYSIKVATDDDSSDWSNYGFYDTFTAIDTDKFSKIEIWVKPGPKAKRLRFLVKDDLEFRDETIISDKNNDGDFLVGQDLDSGKWNKITLDLKQTNYGGVLKNASNLQIMTNDFSTWYWDEAKVVYAPLFKLNLSKMTNSYTELVNGTIRSKFENIPTGLYSWNFNQDGNIENWTMGNLASGVVTGGALKITSTGTDPIIVSPDNLGLNAATNQKIRIRMKNTTSSTLGQLLWTTTTDTIFGGTKYTNFLITSNSDYTEYLVDVSNNSSWSGTIKQLRIDPGITTGDYYIDYIGASKYNITPSVVTTQTDSQAFPNGKIEKILINSEYIDLNGSTNTLPSIGNLIPGVNANKLVVSGYGTKIFYLNSKDSNKLYYYDRNTGINKKLNDYTDITELKTNDNSGNVLYYVRKLTTDSYELRYYNTDYYSDGLVAALNYDPKFSLISNNVLTYATNATFNNGVPERSINYHAIGNGALLLGGPIPNLTSLANSNKSQIFYSYNKDSANGVLKVCYWTYAAWKETELIISPKLLNVTQMLVSGDGKIMYIRVGNDLYLFDVDNKALKQLNTEKVGNIVKVGSDNKVYFADSYGDLFVYDPASDSQTGIRPGTANSSIFDVDNLGTLIIYNSSTGLFSAPIGLKAESTNNIAINQLLLDNDNNGLPDSYIKGGVGVSTFSVIRLSPEAQIQGNIWRLTNSGTSEGYLAQSFSGFSGKPNTTYTVSFKVRHTLADRAKAEVFLLNDYALNGTGTYVQGYTHLSSIGSEVGGVFKKVSFTFTTTNNFPENGALTLRFDHNGNDSGYYDIAEVQIEKAGTSTNFSYGRGVLSSQQNKYLLSFDGKQSWLTYKDGIWKKITNFTPSITEMQSQGMTADEVNALTASDYALLYQHEGNLYSVDVAALFQTPDAALSPQINSISIVLSGDDIKETTLLYSKKQIDYASDNWRTIKRLYPIEIQPKAADVIYFLSNDNGSTLKSYKKGQWQTYQTTLLSSLSQNWDTIMQVGMSKEELKAIPSDQLTDNLLPASNISIVYLTKLDDTSDVEYSSKITIDYIENLFKKESLTLSITLTSGKKLDFAGLSKTDVEEFMTWLNGRQQNKGAVFYRLATLGTDPTVEQNNYFLNYYLIQDIEVNELKP